jgi:diphosphomevalonate decarboxylase
MQPKVSAIAHPNIAFIKYWGNRDDALRLPLNGSISMNLSGLESQTTVQFDEALEHDTFELNGEFQSSASLQRVSQFLDYVRRLVGSTSYARVSSTNNFPTGAGIASSASAFAALALAASKAASLSLIHI